MFWGALCASVQRNQRADWVWIHDQLVSGNPPSSKHNFAIGSVRHFLGKGIRSMYKEALTKYLLTKHRHYAGA